MNLSIVKASENQNIKAAFAHIIGDLVQSLGVVAAAAIIFYKPDWHIIDPLISVVFAVIAISFSIPPLRDIVGLIMDTVPKKLDVDEFKYKLKTIKFVQEVHDLHIWNLTFGKPSLTTHIICSQKIDYVLK